MSPIYAVDMTLSCWQLSSSRSALPDFSTLGAPTRTTSVTSINSYPTFAPTIDGHYFDQNFACQVTGSFAPTDSGTASFKMGSDDGSKLYVDGSLVINNDGSHDWREYTGSNTVVAGQHYVFEATFFQNAGSRSWRINWRPPGASSYSIFTAKTLTMPSPPPPPPPPPAPPMLPTTFPTDLLGWWREADFDHTSSKWRDSSSNGNHASIGGSGCTYSLDPPGHGAQRAVTTLTGTSSCSVSFGTLPSTFTICSATRYTGTQKHRILQAGSINWLHGAWRLLI